MGKLLTDKNPHCIFYNEGNVTGILIGGKKNINREEAIKYFKKNYINICEKDGIYEYARIICFNKEPIAKEIGFDKDEDKYSLLSEIGPEKKYIQSCWYFKCVGLIYR